MAIVVTKKQMLLAHTRAEPARLAWAMAARAYVLDTAARGAAEYDLKRAISLDEERDFWQEHSDRAIAERFEAPPQELLEEDRTETYWNVIHKSF